MWVWDINTASIRTGRKTRLVQSVLAALGELDRELASLEGNDAFDHDAVKLSSCLWSTGGVVVVRLRDVLPLH